MTREPQLGYRYTPDEIGELNAVIDGQRAVIERLTSELKAAKNEIEIADGEIERLTNAIRRIDGINDNPADYNPAINAVCDAILCPHLEPKL